MRFGRLGPSHLNRFYIQFFHTWDLCAMSKKSVKIRYALNKNKYLLEPELERLNYILESFKHKDARNCTLIWVLLHSGARAQETLNLRMEDLNTFDQSIFIRGMKGSNDREIPLPSWLFTRVEQEAGRSQSSQIFPI